MPETTANVLEVWTETKALVSGFLLHRGVHVRRMVEMGRLNRRMDAQGRGDLFKHPDAKLFLEMGKRGLRFAKALEELERATNAVEELLASIEDDQDEKEADARF